MLDILYKNNQLLACNKPPGVAVQPDKTGDVSLLSMAEHYCNHDLHIVNRLDRPVSGIVLFAKTANAMTSLTEQFRNRSIKKDYLAVVQTAPPETSGTLVHYLRKNKQKNMVVAQEKEEPGLERAELDYEVLGNSDRYCLLLVKPHTGRHHQIRAQLAAIGCPVKGDVKYGFRRSNADRSIHLHAWRIRFERPVSGEPIELKASLPQDPLWQAFSATVPAIQ